MDSPKPSSSDARFYRREREGGCGSYGGALVVPVAHGACALLLVPLMAGAASSTSRWTNFNRCLPDPVWRASNTRRHMDPSGDAGRSTSRQCGSDLVAVFIRWPVTSTWWRGPDLLAGDFKPVARSRSGGR
jgi:hypothetical protein